METKEHDGGGRKRKKVRIGEDMKEEHGRGRGIARSRKRLEREGVEETIDMLRMDWIRIGEDGKEVMSIGDFSKNVAEVAREEHNERRRGARRCQEIEEDADYVMWNAILKERMLLENKESQIRGILTRWASQCNRRWKRKLQSIRNKEIMENKRGRLGGKE